jgi:hypothetical protein
MTLNFVYAQTSSGHEEQHDISQLTRTGRCHANRRAKWCQPWPSQDQRYSLPDTSPAPPNSPQTSQNEPNYLNFTKILINKKMLRASPRLSRVLFLASECLSKQVRVVPSINTPTRVNPSLFCSQKKEPCVLL